MHPLITFAAGRRRALAHTLISIAIFLVNGALGTSAAAAEARDLWYVGRYTGQVGDGAATSIFTLSCETPTRCQYSFAPANGAATAAGARTAPKLERIDPKIANNNLRHIRQAVAERPAEYDSPRNGPLLRVLRPLLESGQLFEECVGEPELSGAWGHICRTPASGGSLPDLVFLVTTMNPTCNGQVFCAYYMFPLKRAVGAAAPSAPSRSEMPSPSSASAAQRPTTPSRSCAFENAALPEDYVLYAAGAYSGRPLDVQIDQSGHQATHIDVVVNSQKKPVVLMLGAYEPTIWNISWTKDTEILAVYASGYHRQAIAGLHNKVPTLVSTYENRGPCGYFYLGTDNLGTLNPHARRVFGRPVDTAWRAKNGSVVIGEPILPGTRVETSTDTSPDVYVDRNAPKAGQAGLEDAVRRGVLRKATAADAQAWVDAVARSTPSRDIPPVAGEGIPGPAKPATYNGYVVLKPFSFPAGLYGGHAATFFVPAGVAKPSGNPGHSVVYDFNTLQCSGVTCSNR